MCFCTASPHPSLLPLLMLLMRVWESAFWALCLFLPLCCCLLIYSGQVRSHLIYVNRSLKTSWQVGQDGAGSLQVTAGQKDEQSKDTGGWQIPGEQILVFLPWPGRGPTAGASLTGMAAASPQTQCLSWQQQHSARKGRK